MYVSMGCRALDLEEGLLTHKHMCMYVCTHVRMHVYIYV